MNMLRAVVTSHTVVDSVKMDLTVEEAKTLAERLQWAVARLTGKEDWDLSFDCVEIDNLVLRVKG